ncbi:MAG TPA: hypothetical protein VGP10_03915 [Marisediminicola sp.]|nr:hypothetical protein [Marisediminicola sp.]
MTSSRESTHETPPRAHSAVMCAALETGYELHPIQRQAALATTSKWRDATVVEVTAEGWIELLDLATDARARVWHYSDLTASITPGEPVSINAHYGVLAFGHHYISVRSA